MWGRRVDREVRVSRIRMNETPVSTRIVGALLALGVVVVHVGDQGGVTTFADPDWLGWAYRLIEVGGLLTAIVLLVAGGWRPAWGPALLLAAGPFVGYLATRTIGLPNDAGDVGNWDDWGGTMSLLVEAALFVLAAGVLLKWQPAPGPSPDAIDRSRGVAIDHRPIRRFVRENQSFPSQQRRVT